MKILKMDCKMFKILYLYKIKTIQPTESTQLEFSAGFLESYIISYAYTPIALPILLPSPATLGILYNIPLTHQHVLL